MFKKWKTLSKHEKRSEIIKWIFIVIGTMLISFSGVAFLVPTNINSGGLSGIGIVVIAFVNLPEDAKMILYNVVTFGASVIFWVLGLIFMGKDFAFKTLLSTIVYPLANAFFSLVPGVKDAVASIYTLFLNGVTIPTTGDLLLLGIFGGGVMGAGISMTFLAGGSSGGVDVLSFLLQKYVHIKKSFAVLIVDGVIIGSGIITALIRQDAALLKASMTGIITSIVLALVVELLYVSTQRSYQADIISDKWEDISKFAQDVLKRGATVIEAKGGYKGDDRVVLRVVFDATQYPQLRSYISKVDPKAFVTVSRTNATYGEGFISHKKD